jgi:hypothetical protein
MSRRFAAVLANPERLAPRPTNFDQNAKKLRNLIFYFSLSRRLRLFWQIPSAYPMNGEPRSKHETTAKSSFIIFRRISKGPRS